MDANGVGHGPDATQKHPLVVPSNVMWPDRKHQGIIHLQETRWSSEAHSLGTIVKGVFCTEMQNKILKLCE